MKKILLILLALLSLSLPAWAEQTAQKTISTNLYSIEQTEPAGLNIIVFTSKAHDAVVTLVQGSAGDSDLNTIAESFAEQYKAHEKPVYKDDVAYFNYTTYEGDDGSARIMVQDGQFIVATMSGDLHRSRVFLSKFSSEKFDGLFSSDETTKKRRDSK